MDVNDRLWRRAKRYIALSQATPAKVTLESLIARDPNDAAAHLLLGGLYAIEGHLRAWAAQALAAANCPIDEPEALGEVINALLRVGEIVVARRLLDSAPMASSNSVPVLMNAAQSRQLIGEHASALALMEQARAAGAEGKHFYFQYAVELAFNGQMDASRAALERCISHKPPLGRAYVQLARMRTQTSASNDLQIIESALTQAPPESEDRIALEFARYKVLEDLQCHDEAWQSLSRGNALAHRQFPHDSAREELIFDRLIESCDALPSAPGIDSDDTGPQPIFVLGMPRSGTTVLERILGTHSQVQSAGELGDFGRALAMATDHRATMLLLDETTVARIGRVDWAQLGQRYLQQTRWRACDKAFFVDKLPANWMLAGLIPRALPRARILHIVRDPMDVCFSNWRAYFGAGDEFAYAYDLETLVAHYRQYRRMMDYWARLVPGAIFNVDYAQLVHAPATITRNILAFCGLAFEPGCGELEHNTTPSATLSMSQIRQPIHARAFGEWRPYAGHLTGLQTALQEHQS